MGKLVMDAASQVGFEDQYQNGIQTRSPRTYNFLLRLSRRMGSVATYSSLMTSVGTYGGAERVHSAGNRAFMAPLLGHAATNSQQETEQERRDKDKKLKNIVSKSHEVLMSANTVFPITLFPDTVTVDRTKITITRRDFFWTSDVISFRIEDILNVSASVGPFFGALTLASRVMSTVDHFKINHLWRNDAIRLKHIIQGYVIAQHNNIDTTHLSTPELIDTLRELGHDS